MKKIQNKLFILTILFFALGFIHISLSLLGLLCFTLPFIQYFKYKDKIWCKYYCPRAGYFSKVVSKINMGKKIPTLLTSKKFKKGVVVYFIINLFFATMSTIMVGLGRVEAMDFLRFLIAFPIPFDMPQLIIINLPDFIIHFSYRVYSIMLTSVVIGSILGIIYKPRTWCSICPISTLTSKKGIDTQVSS